MMRIDSIELVKFRKIFAVDGGWSKRNNLEIDKPVESEIVKPKSEVVAELGLTQKQAERFQQMAQNPDAVQAAMTKARAAGVNP